MADAAISVSSSGLATLLAAASGDQPSVGPSTAAKPSDPFAALLANAAADKPQLVAANKSDLAGAPDPIATLLASTAVVPATPAGTSPLKINPIISSQPAAVPVSRAADIPAIEEDETPVASKSDDSGDRDDEPEGQGNDPLADAIASGATAVLALAPAIVAPPTVAAPARAVAPAPIRIGAPTAPVATARLASPPRGDQPVKQETGNQPTTAIALPSEISAQSQLATLPVARAAQSDADQPLAVQSQARVPAQSELTVRVQAEVAVPTPSQVAVPTPSQAATPTPSQAAVLTESQAAVPTGSQARAGSAVPAPVGRATPISAQPDLGKGQGATALMQPTAADSHDSSSAPADARSTQLPAPTSAPMPEQPVLPTEAAKAVVTLLRRDDAAAPSGENVMAAPIVVATKPEAQPAAPPAATQKSHGETLAPQPPVHHRTADASAPRRPADTRRRADVAASDSGVTAATQGAAEPRASSQPAGIPAAPAKADAVVQQTLTIARDGAWLDRLARDIASAGNGGDLQFKLDPQHLGSLSVAITQGTDGASIRLTADNDATRNLLLDAQPKLLAEARAQGLRVSDTHVDLNQNQTQSQNQGQSQQNQQGQHQAQAQTANQDLSRWAQGGSNQNGGTQNGQNRQSSPGHQPFVSNLGRKAEADSESSDGDSGALYA